MLDFGGVEGRSGRKLKPGEVEKPQNRASCSILGAVEGCGGRLKLGEVEIPQTKHNRSNLGVVARAVEEGGSKTAEIN